MGCDGPAMHFHRSGRRGSCVGRARGRRPGARVQALAELRDGRSETERIEVMYGHPARPMTRAAQLDKFGTNCERAARPIAPEAAERVIAAVARLESLPDVTALVDDLVPAPATDPSPD